MILWFCIIKLAITVLLTVSLVDFFAMWQNNRVCLWWLAKMVTTSIFVILDTWSEQMIQVLDQTRSPLAPLKYLFGLCNMLLTQSSRPEMPPNGLWALVWLELWMSRTPVVRFDEKFSSQALLHPSLRGWVPEPKKNQQTLVSECSHPMGGSSYPIVGILWSATPVKNL